MRGWLEGQLCGQHGCRCGVCSIAQTVCFLVARSCVELCHVVGSAASCTQLCVPDAFALTHAVLCSSCSSANTC